MHRPSRLQQLTRPVWLSSHARHYRPLQPIVPRSTFSSLRRPPRAMGPRSRILPHAEQRAATTPRYEATKFAEPAPQEIAVEPPISTAISVPENRDGAVITSEYHGAPLIAQSALIVGRQYEMMNIFLGFEQANRYKIMDPHGNQVGFIAEEEGMLKSVGRQLMRTHRPLKATVMDASGNVVFKIDRPFSFINSRIFIYTADDQLVGEVQQRWHLLRRKYDLFTGHNQFASIDTPFLGWDFNLQDEQGGTLGNVSRNFVGFAREIFTDTGEYVLRMDAAQDNARGMSLDERAVTLACAISIDFDFFSRHSSHGAGGFMPFPFFGWGGGQSDTENPSSQDPDQPSSPSSMPPNSPQAPPTHHDNAPTPNEYGDIWMDDEQAGVSNPSDQGFIDTLSDFFRDSD